MSTAGAPNFRVCPIHEEHRNPSCATCRTLNEPAPLTVVDLDGDGLDDRAELAWTVADRIHNAIASALAKAPRVPARQPYPPPPSLAYRLDILRAVPYRSTRWPSPVARDASGYDYRSVPAAELCRLVGLPLDVGALAACLASEAPRYPAYELAIAEAVVNECGARGMSPHERITMDGVRVRGPGGRATYARAAGHFGRQRGRWCASLQAPTERHVRAAAMALGTPAESRWTRGARRWVDLYVMRRGMQAGRKLEHDDLGILRKWYAEGWHWVGPHVDVQGSVLIDPFRLCLLAREGAHLAAAEAMAIDGRKRWHVA